MALLRRAIYRQNAHSPYSESVTSNKDFCQPVFPAQMPMGSACSGLWELTNQRRGAAAPDTVRTITSFRAKLKQKRDRET